MNYELWLRPQPIYLSNQCCGLQVPYELCQLVHGYAALMIYELVYNTIYAAPSCYYCVPYESLIMGKD